MKVYVLSTANPNWRDVRKRAAEYVASLPVGTAKLAVEIKPYRATRSAEQNRLLWALYNDIAEQAVVRGNRFSADCWHEFLCGELLGKTDMRLPNGEIVTRRVSTASLNVEEFSNYVDRVSAWGADQGVVFEERRAA